jgi:hypothetical protein
MNINKDFQKVMKRQEWDRRNTEKFNTLCRYDTCHSNCHIRCGLGFSLDSVYLGNRCEAFKSQGGQNLGNSAICDVCGHPAEYHGHFYVEWYERDVEETTIDQDAKRDFEAAKSVVEQMRVIERALTATITNMDRRRQAAQRKVEDLCGSFNSLAISGSFAGRLASMIKLLQIRYETRKHQAAPLDELDSLERSIKQLRSMYNVLSGNPDTQDPTYSTPDAPYPSSTGSYEYQTLPAIGGTQSPLDPIVEAQSKRKSFPMKLMKKLVGGVRGLGK